jgi:hypothetical protein
MPYRRHWLLAALLLLPLLIVSSGSGDARALTGEHRLGSGGQQVLEQPIERRRAIIVGAIEPADEEEGPPKTLCRAYTTVCWPRAEPSVFGHDDAPSPLGGAPVACTAQPRAPPARS